MCIQTLFFFNITDVMKCRAVGWFLILFIVFQGNLAEFAGAGLELHGRLVCRSLLFLYKMTAVANTFMIMM